MARAKKLSPQPHEYLYTVGWSEEDQVYIGRVAEFPSLAAHGKTLEAALKEIKFVVTASLEWLTEEGEPLPEPLSRRRYSGKLNLRLPEALHRQLALEAARQGISLSQLIKLKLAAATANGQG